MSNTVHLPTVKGHIDIREAQRPGKCVGCNTMGGGMAEVETGTETNQARFHVCGNCLGQALSGRIGEYIGRAKREHDERIERAT